MPSGRSWCKKSPPSPVHVKRHHIEARGLVYHLSQKQESCAHKIAANNNRRTALRTAKGKKVKRWAKEGETRTYRRHLEEVGPRGRRSERANVPNRRLTGKHGVSISVMHPVGGICPVAVGEGAGKGGTLLRRGRSLMFSLLISSFMHRQHITTLQSLPCPLAPAPRGSPIIFVMRIPRSARRENARSPKFLS